MVVLCHMVRSSEFRSSPNHDTESTNSNKTNKHCAARRNCGRPCEALLKQAYIKTCLNTLTFRWKYRQGPQISRNNIIIQKWVILFYSCYNHHQLQIFTLPTPIVPQTNFTITRAVVYGNKEKGKNNYKAER